MNISQDITNYRPENGLTVPAGERRKVDQVGRYFVLKSVLIGGVPSTTEIEVCIGKGSKTTPWPVLYSFQTRQPSDWFDVVTFYNPSASDMVVDFFISSDWIDNKSNDLTTSGALPVIDTSNTITTYQNIVALPRSFLIDNAAAVNVGGGVVGIPVTSNPFATGEILTITGTVNYDGVAYAVLASSGVNQVDITAAFVAEVFDGVDDRIALTTARSRAADATRKELVVYNTHDTLAAHWGDTQIITLAGTYPGEPILPLTTWIIPTTDEVFFTADELTGKAGATLRLTALRTV